jgi:hypothetical protein
MKTTEKSNNHQISMDDERLLVAGDYYKINGTKRVLYWDGEEWMKPVKDQQKRYGTWNSRIEKQPNVKTVELVDIHGCY